MRSRRVISLLVCIVISTAIQLVVQFILEDAKTHPNRYSQELIETILFFPRLIANTLIAIKPMPNETLILVSLGLTAFWGGTFLWAVYLAILAAYKFSRSIKADWLLKSLLLPPAYKKEIMALDM